MGIQESARRDHSPKHKATKLLDWLTEFLPTAIPRSPEQAILDTSGDVNALLWHRSELETILEETPSALTSKQKQRLAALDGKLRQSTLLIVGAEKGYLRRFRESRYNRSHWWWYLDDILQEESMAKRQGPPARAYDASTATRRSTTKVADRRTSYDGTRTGKKPGK